MECSIDPITGNVDVSKTGMGSSAALTTSLVGALLKFQYCPFRWPSAWLARLGRIQLYLLVLRPTRRSAQHKQYKQRRRKGLVHNLAQVAHSVAQGKIGSGFDVAAAVYGTQTYSRFSSSILDAVLERPTADSIYNAVVDRDNWTQNFNL